MFSFSINMVSNRTVQGLSAGQQVYHYTVLTHSLIYAILEATLVKYCCLLLL